MGADIWLQASTIYGSVIQWDTCGSVLDQYNCQDLGYAPPSSNSSTFYKPNNLHPNGTRTLFNTRPADPLTAPTSGSVFTWSQFSVTYIVTASPWKNSQVIVTATGIAATAGTSSAAATGSAKTGAAMATKQFSLIGLAFWLPVMGVLVKIMLV